MYYFLGSDFVEGFCEQVVKVKIGAKQIVFTVLLVLAFLIPVVFLMMLYYASATVTPRGDYFYSLFALVLAMLGAFVIWVVVPRITKVEYDYSVYGSDFIIAKVTAKSTRKRKVKFEIKNVEKLAKISEVNLPDGKYAKKFNFAGGAPVEDIYFAEFRLAQRGLCLLLFAPNEKILSGMRPYLNREIALKLFAKKK